MITITSTVDVATVDGDVVINHHGQPDAAGIAYILFSPDQARHLARILVEQAEVARAWQEAKRRANLPPVDRSLTTLTDGSPVTEDHREINPTTGQQKGYVVLSEEERRKGFVRPVRRSYRHITCKSTTTMGLALAETYARDPSFYSGTFCSACRKHFALDQFVWEGSSEKLGT